jgi:hypothetical protein
MATGWPSFLRPSASTCGGRARRSVRLIICGSPPSGSLVRDFPAFDVGAMPPFATTPLPEVVDLRLLRHDRIVCAGGEHRCSVRIDALELLRITEPRVADICEHPDERELADRRQPF